jgi:ribosomal subunit interface protein
MDIRVSGHQIDTGTALQEHASDRIGTIVDKYFSRAQSSTVTFGKAPSKAFDCDIVLHVSKGLILKSHGSAHDAHQSFDQAADKIEKQLRRYKRRLKDRHEQSPTRSARRKRPIHLRLRGTGTGRRRRGCRRCPASDRRNPRRYPGSQRIGCRHAARPAPYQCAVLQKRWHRAGIIWFTAAAMARSAGSNRPDRTGQAAAWLSRLSVRSRRFTRIFNAREGMVGPAGPAETGQMECTLRDQARFGGDHRRRWEAGHSRTAGGAFRPRLGARRRARARASGGARTAGQHRLRPWRGHPPCPHRGYPAAGRSLAAAASIRPISVRPMACRLNWCSACFRRKTAAPAISTPWPRSRA